MVPKNITAPSIIMRGEHDVIFGIDDLVLFYAALPNPDKHFAVIPGIAHASFQRNNYLMDYHILYAFSAQPAPVYPGE